VPTTGTAQRNQSPKQAQTHSMWTTPTGPTSPRPDLPGQAGGVGSAQRPRPVL